MEVMKDVEFSQCLALHREDPLEKEKGEGIEFRDFRKERRGKVFLAMQRECFARV